MKEKERIPLFSSWNRWYLFVMVVLAGMIIFFCWFTKYFS